MSKHKVVIIGGGFGGLYAAKHLRDKNIDVTLVDRRNHHLFQPLLYQVATGGLSPGDIASPLRAVFKGRDHFHVIQGEVVDIMPDRKEIRLRDRALPYDTLILATGMVNHYFGNDHWRPHATGLKSLEDALEMRRRILNAFEQAELEPDPKKRGAWLNFVIVGAGPTGVELAGALAELANNTMRGDFSNINPADARIILVEGMDRVLGAMSPKNSASAQKSLEELGVEIRLKTMVQDIEEGRILVKTDDTVSEIETKTVLWGAGVKASPLGQVLEEKVGAERNRGGKVIVDRFLRVPSAQDIYVIGDLAAGVDDSGKPLPGMAPVAMQQGRYVARQIRGSLRGKKSGPFHYLDKGSLAVIGRNAAVADIRKLKLSGFFAWVIWAFVHIMYLVEFDNRIVVGFQWFWNYLTRKRGARLITETSTKVALESRGNGSSEKSA